ncbi:MAG: Gfo/Idh/MocA family oxidoreductase [Anaerolineae bacterium]|nr:Gfo/Idh/MocA family oxidoreductase [Anaerolineae bacterium]
MGVGNIAERHAQGYLAIPELAQITAVADISPQIAQVKAAQWGVPVWYPSLDKLLASDVDVVDICLPHDLHVSAAKAAAQSRKHIYIEKPLARTARECIEIYQAVEQAGVFMMVGHNLLFNPLMTKAQALVTSGAVGQVFMIRGASYGWPPFRAGNFRLERAKSGGGVLIDTGVHILYLMRAMGGEARSVSATMSHALRSEMQGEDNALVHLQYANGALGEMAVSYSTKLSTYALGFPDGWDQRIEVYGTDGTLKVDLVRGTLQIFAEGAESHPILANWAVANKKLQGTTLFELPNVYFDSFKFAIHAFAQTLLSGGPSPVSVSDGYRVMQLVDAAYESAREGRYIHVSQG